MKILYMDTRRTWHTLVKKVLSARGNEVIHAYQPEEVVKLVEAENPDIVVIDITSEFNPAGILAQLREKAVPVLVVGYEEKGLAPEHFKSLGATDVLQKPYTVDQFVEALEKTIEKKEEEEFEVVLAPEGEAKPAPQAPTLEVPEEAVPVEEVTPTAPEEVQIVPPAGEELPPQPLPPPPPAVKPEEVAPAPPPPPPQPPAPPPPPPQPLAPPPAPPAPAQPPPAPEPERVAPAPSVTPETAKEVLSDRAYIEALIKEVIWEVVPEIAEKVIREEIEKLIKSRLA